MRKLTAEERAAKNAVQQVVAEEVEPKKKAKKAEKAEPRGIGSDSFVFSSDKSVEEDTPVFEEKAEEVAEIAAPSEEVTDK